MAIRRKIAVTALGFCLLLLGAWLLNRVSEFGIKNVFSREHHFSDERALTEEVAIDITRQALEADGYDITVLAPVEYYSQLPEGITERIFVRNTLNPNSGKVYWGPAQRDSPIKGNPFLVRIEKHGSDIRCRVYKGK